MLTPGRLLAIERRQFAERQFAFGDEAFGLDKAPEKVFSCSRELDALFRRAFSGSRAAPAPSVPLVDPLERLLRGVA